MKIAGATFYRYSLPLARSLRFHDVEIERRDGLIVAIRSDDGAVGYGEIAPLPGFSTETLEDALAVAQRCVGNLKRRQDVGTSVPALRDREMFPPPVRYGIESALLDLTARMRKVSPASLLSETFAHAVPLNALLMGTPDEVMHAGRAALASGYKTIKLKVGRAAIEEDIETVRGLRQTLGDAIEIRLDANRAWAFDVALGFARDVADCRIDYIEEPINEPERLGEFFALTPIGFAVDETLQEVGWERLFAWRQGELLEPFAELPADADPLLHAILSARVWVVKPTLVGMPLAYTAQLLAKRRRIDADLAISSSFESGLGLVSLANLAASGGEDSLPAGLDTASWFADDVLPDRLPVRNGAMDLAEANGIAARFSPDALEVVSDD